jgi:hypothetical protein
VPYEGNEKIGRRGEKHRRKMKGKGKMFIPSNRVLC